MLAESFACPACTEGIPPGRLSCPHCGTVLAAVARSFSAAEPTGLAGAMPPARSWLDANSGVEPQIEPGLDAEASWDPEPVPAPVAALLASSDTPARTLEPVGLVPGSAAGSPMDRWAQIAAVPVTPPAAAPPPSEPLPASAASYVPPSPASAESVEPPARILPRTWGPAGPAAMESATEAPSTTRTGRFALPTIDRRRVDEAAGVLVLAGSMAAAIGFLLPWSRIVIGATFTGSYLDTWGLAGAAHVVVFLLSLGVLALAAIPNQLGTWLRTGVAGIALGALLLGLAWPYAFGRLGAGLGVVLEVAAAALLLGGGLLSALVQRHAEPTPGV